MTKKLLSLVLALVMSLTLVASVALADEPVELSIVVRRRDTDITEDFHEKYWVRKTEEDLGIKLNFIEITESDYATEIAAILASGKLPDCFFVGNSMNDALMAANSKLWYVLTEEEIREKCPNTVAVYEKYIGDWQSYLTYPDGNIYGFTSGLLDSFMHTTDKGIMYINKTWLDNLNLAVPTTADELLTVLRAFRDQDADGDGDPTNEIPFDFCEAFFASKIEFLAWMWGLPITESIFYKINEEGNVEGAIDTDAFRAFLEYAHLMADEKLMSLDGFTQTYDQWAANLNSMKVGVFFGWGPCNYITEADDFLNITGMLVPSAEGYTAAAYAANPIRAQRNGFVISKDCQNVDAALRLWNYWSDPEMAVTVTFGPRHLNWDWVDDDYNFLTIPIEDEDLIAFGNGLEIYAGKTYTGSNTLGYVNNGPLCPHSEGYDTSDLTRWGVQRYVALQNMVAANQFAPYMNKDIVPDEKQEEYDFTTDGLTNMVKEFVAQSVRDGVTDASWEQFKSNLNNYGYDFYIDFFNAKYHHEL